MQSAFGEGINGSVSQTGAMRARHDHKFWRAAVAEQRASSKTIEVFCAERGIGRSTFQRWAKRLTLAGKLSTIEVSPLRQKTTAVQSLPQFLEVPIAARANSALIGQAAKAASSAGEVVEVTLDAGLRLTLSGEAAGRVITAVVRRIEGGLRS